MSRKAPALAMQSVRLYRQVAVYDQLYTFLRQALEQAKIDERRDIPTFTVLDQPVETIVQRILDRVTSHRAPGRPDDDVTCVMVRVSAPKE